MAKSQRVQLTPPIPEDQGSLIDFAGQVQTNLKQLFNFAHEHPVLLKNPSPLDGSIQQVSIVDDGTNVYLVVKTSRGWFKSPSFTAI